MSSLFFKKKKKKEREKRRGARNSLTLSVFSTVYEEFVVQYVKSSVSVGDTCI